MDDIKEFELKINQYRTRISFIILVMAIFLIVIGLLARRLFLVRPPVIPVSGIELKRLEFEILTQGLVSKSKPVVFEPNEEIEKGIGKPEPFQ